MDAIYARQSIDKKDSVSIETQIELCKREGGSDKQYLIYIDRGYSGKNLQRPDFQRMLREVRQGRISRIIIYRLDRLSRSLLDFASLLELFRQYGVAFVSTQEKFDTATPMGMAMLNIAMVFAQLERETIQSRVKDNYYSRAKGGTFTGGRPPFGYSIALTHSLDNGKAQKTLAGHPGQAPLLRQLFQMYGEQLLSLSAIAQRLNRQKLPSPAGSVWDSSKINRILRNPIYVKADATVYQYYQRKGCIITNELSEFIHDRACFLYGKRNSHSRKFSDVQGHFLSLALHQGLIEAPLFLKCQRLLDNNIRFGARHGSGKSWLTPLLRCGHCGATLRVNASNGGRYLYYSCQNRPRGVCCGKFISCSVAALEQEIEPLLLQQAQLLAPLQVKGAIDCSPQLKQAQVQLVQVDTAISRLIDLALQGGELTGQYLEQKLRLLEDQRRQAEAAVLRLQNSPSARQLPPQPSQLVDYWPLLSIAQKQELAALFIERIEIDDQQIKLYWKHQL